MKTFVFEKKARKDKRARGKRIPSTPCCSITLNRAHAKQGAGVKHMQIRFSLRNGAKAAVTGFDYVIPRIEDEKLTFSGSDKEFGYKVINKDSESPYVVCSVSDEEAEELKEIIGIHPCEREDDGRYVVKLQSQGVLL